MKKLLCFIVLSAVLMITAGCGSSGNTAEKDTVDPVKSESAASVDEAQKAAAPEEQTKENIEETEEAPFAGETVPKTVEVTDIPEKPLMAKAAEGAAPITLTKVGETMNDISDIEKWKLDNGLSLSDMYSGSSGLRFPADEQYQYIITENTIDIEDKKSGDPLYTVVFTQGLGEVYCNWAALDGNILYTIRAYNGYASYNSCYLMAVDLETGKVLWRSEDQTCNTDNFLIMGDVIICGYGFTEEKDYIYQIDKNTGQTIYRQLIAKKADCLIEKDGCLYVHTYDRDYVFRLEIKE